jgi:hypothetical protein
MVAKVHEGQRTMQRNMGEERARVEPAADLWAADRRGHAGACCLVLPDDKDRHSTESSEEGGGRLILIAL